MVEMVWRGLVLNSTASMRESGIVYDFVTKIPSTVWVFMTSFFRMEKFLSIAYLHLRYVKDYSEDVRR